MYILCIVIVGFFLFQKSFREGFQAYRELNVDYLDEIFLVGYPGNAANPTYENGYTKADAQKACEQFGATLATKQEMSTLKDISANWCAVGGWVADDDANLYFPNDPTAKRGAASCLNPPGSSVFGGPSNETRIHIRKMPVPPSGKGFANCRGVKPSAGTSGVQELNETAYSYFDTDAMIRLMNGDNEDMVPFVFSRSQALYAMLQTQFNRTQARELLRTTFGTTLNQNVRAAADPSTVARDTESWVQAKAKSCDALNTVYTEVLKRLAALKAVVAAVQGQTMGTYYAKKENMDLQKEIAYVCVNLTAANSPACRRLASIDFDTFYKATDGAGTADTKVLADLEDLNSQLTMRECEIQRAALKMETLLGALRCGGGSEMRDVPDATKALLGQYYIPSRASYFPDTDANPLCKLQDDDPKWREFFEENGDSRFTIRKNIGYVNSEMLRSALEEISPFFAASGYTELFPAILNQLSILLRQPTLNDYMGSDSNLNEVSNKSRGILDRMTRIFVG